MAVTTRKLINRIRDAAMRYRSSPVDADATRSPFADAIAAYWERDMLTFSIPAHNGGRGIAPEFTRWTGAQTARADLPMTHGLDTRNAAYGIQQTAQTLFAEAVGARETLFSTGGSSQSARVAILTVAGPGETLVMARNGHKSAFAGLILSGARPVYVDPVYDEELEIAHGVSGDAVAAALDAHPEARAAMIFSPSYYGTSTDIAAVADAVHARGLPLVSDDAWGLDYAFASLAELPPGALQQGSDLAIGSVHKTLSGLSQTSVLSVGSERIDSQRLHLCFELEQSTSSSPLLLSSIDGARTQFQRDGGMLLRRGLETASRLRTRLAEEVPELRVISPAELEARPGVLRADPMHVMIETAPLGLTGYRAIDWIRERHHIDVELIDHRRIMPLLSYAHSSGDVERLVRALRDLVDRHRPRMSHVPELPRPAVVRGEQAMLPRDAFFAPSAAVSPAHADGRVSAELITPYPPGIPAVAPGERYTPDSVAYLEAFVAAGGFVEGASDPQLGTLRVVAA